MNIEIITIGNELVNGMQTDTNSQWIAERLTISGAHIKKITSIGDDVREIINTLDKKRHAGLVIVTGGLGPTSDDITKQAICTWKNTPLIEDARVSQDINDFFNRRKLTLTARNHEQALVPKGVTVLRNKLGTAPGLLTEQDGTGFVFLPGVPLEMKTLIEEEVIPMILQNTHGKSFTFNEVIFIGIGESFLADKLMIWEKSLPAEWKLAYLPSPGFVRVRLSAYTNNLSVTAEQIISKLKEAISICPKYGINTEGKELNHWFIDLLKKKNLTIALAESCTGGYFSHILTSVPGSSDCYKGSFIVYSNESKISLAGVDPDTLRQHGAVSQLVVEELATNIKKLHHTNIGVAISGIAGPDGGSGEKPVGTVWIAVASPMGIISQQFIFGADRFRNIQRATLSALLMVVQNI